jgi:hypothetical protein
MGSGCIGYVFLISALDGGGTASLDDTWWRKFFTLPGLEPQPLSSLAHSHSERLGKQLKCFSRQVDEKGYGEKF